MAVIAVSLLCAAADSLMPPGAVKKVGKLVCSLSVLCVTISPLSAMRGASLTDRIEDFSGQIGELRAELEEETGQNQKAVIEEHCAAYISDKAAELGIVCRVEVDCVPHPDGLWLPACVRLWGDFNDVAQSRLTGLLEGQLGIPAAEQSYYLTKEEGP